MNNKSINQLKNIQKKYQKLAQKLFSQWNNALVEATEKENGGGKVAEMYLENDEELIGELFGTVSNQIRTGQKEIAKYFEHFLKSNPRGEVKNMKIIPIDNKTFLMGGEYIFELDNGQDGRQEVEANFTYVWRQNDNNKWKILHHHSAKKTNTENEVNFNQLKLNSLEVTEKGIDKKIAPRFVLKTFFYKEGNETEKRATVLVQVKENQPNIVYSQISDKPDSSSGV